MAYAAVDSLKFTILRPLSSIFSLDHSSREILQVGSEGVKSLKEIVRRMLLSSTSSLDLEMGVAISKLQDVITSHLSQEIVHAGRTISFEVQFSMGLQDLKQAFQSTMEILEKMEEEYVHDLEREEDDGDSPIIGYGERESKMVRLSDQYTELKSCLMKGSRHTSEPIVVSLVGMPGIGKTTLAMEIFEDPDIVEHFECRVWVTIGTKYRFEEIGRCILARVDPKKYGMVVGADKDHIARCLKESLKGRRYLIVLDDVRNKYMAHHLSTLDLEERNELKNPFPLEVSGGRVLLTTRLIQVDDLNLRIRDDVVTMRLLNKEESWDLLCEKVFGEELCPPQLEKAGKKIAENCDGLPLTIVTVADLLSKGEKTLQYWSEVAEKKNHLLFKTAYNEISKVLYSCYNDLTHALKLCFYYMGIFPQNYEIPRSKVINMWDVDGFLELNVHKLSCPGAIECLKELVSSNLVMIYQRTIDPTSALTQIKTCGLHSSLWHLSNRESRKAKFCLVLNAYDDGFGEAIERQSRLSFHNNILFGIKDVHKSVEDNCASTTRSLLCYGLYQQYEVPICSSLRLLRELDALTIRFYEFPIEVLQLIELRYLALTMNGKLPPSISQLSNLQFLIVSRHLSIKSCQDPLYMPVEIWNLKELKHLQVMGSDLLDPYGTSLKSLTKLANVSSYSCTKDVLRAIPNLKKLGIYIELVSDGDGEPFSCFDHISHVETLTSLKCVVAHPKVTPSLAPLSIFPSNLRKLSLSGLGYPWRELNKIASSLALLTVLKLRSYAFRGPEWEVGRNKFNSLHLLVIEDTDLVEWRIEHVSFCHLQSLLIKHCYKLEKIHGELVMYKGHVEVVDCNPLCVKQIEKATAGRYTEICVHSSWEAKTSQGMENV